MERLPARRLPRRARRGANGGVTGGRDGPKEVRHLLGGAEDGGLSPAAGRGGNARAEFENSVRKLD